MFKIIIIILVCTILEGCFSLTPIDYTFPTDTEVKSNSTEKPLGFSYEVLAHPPLQGGNFKIKLSGLENVYLDFKIETVNDDVSICVKCDQISTVPICGLGQVFGCVDSAAETQICEFYCDESCSSTSSEGYRYRVIKSPSGADDTWCSSRQTDVEYPSDLIVGEYVPQPSRKPRTTVKKENSAALTMPSVIVLILSLFVFKLYH